MFRGGRRGLITLFLAQMLEGICAGHDKNPDHVYRKNTLIEMWLWWSCVCVGQQRVRRNGKVNCGHATEALLWALLRSKVRETEAKRQTDTPLSISLNIKWLQSAQNMFSLIWISSLWWMWESVVSDLKVCVCKWHYTGTNCWSTSSIWEDKA